MTDVQTLLKALVIERLWSYRDFEREFRRTARRVLGFELTVSEAQFRRWTSGSLTKPPRAEACRVLEEMFGVVPTARLFAPPEAHPAEALPEFDLEAEIAMTARDAQDRAGASAALSVSDISLDQLREDVLVLARGYSTFSPQDVFHRAKSLREEAETLRDRTAVPVQQQDLVVLAGQTCALLATAAFDLGALDGAKRLARSAALYGEVARFDPLRAFAGGSLAFIAYFSDRPSEAVRFAQAAQAFGGLGDVARRRLATIEARAYGHLGNEKEARQALRVSEQEGNGFRDELHDDVGGEFGFPDERLAMSHGSTYLLLNDGPGAEVAARRALELIEQRPITQQSGSIRGKAAADLAAARLLSGDLDGSAKALEMVWGIPAQQRVTGLLERTSRIRYALTAQPFRETPAATALGERLEDFQRASAHHSLGPGGRRALEA
ncbi:DNA-binding protein [Peterkaempfera bronchialis]|uniref:DNA-binding protein n=1 Tax=Peterkaempfera bronchialis TaxID=2126346 RepID=A0A345T5X2_9ACTN|nr:DNA-binding protein [Peterkaempfera bronchialis]AXI81377.1 DNA-binding protein [Peterkaempfera bronchialis]